MKLDFSNLYLILVVAAIFGALYAISDIIFVTGLLINSNIPSLAGYLIGMTLSYFVFSLAILFGIAALLNVVINIFKKGKKGFNFSLLWIPIILLFILAISSTTYNKQIYKSTSQEHDAFITACVKGATDKFAAQNVIVNQNNTALNNITNICKAMSDDYFNIYDNCLDTAANKTQCKWLASYTGMTR